MTRDYILAIDPGQKGGAALMYPNGEVKSVAFQNCLGSDTLMVEARCEGDRALAACQTFHQIGASLDFITANIPADEISAFCELVASRPDDHGVWNNAKASFSFGRNYGTAIGWLLGKHIPVTLILPNAWEQMYPSVRNISDYRSRKAALLGCAQKLYPQLKPTLDDCDALLLLRYVTTENL